MHQMTAFDAEALALDQFPCATFSCAAFTHCDICSIFPYTFVYLIIRHRSESEWIGPLLLVVALLSVAVLRFCTIRSDESGACQSNAAAATHAGSSRDVKSSLSSHTQEPTRSQALASANSQPCRAHDAAPEQVGTFAEDFQIAVQFKSANKLAEAGQWHNTSVANGSHIVALLNHSIFQNCGCKNSLAKHLPPTKLRFEHAVRFPTVA